LSSHKLRNERLVVDRGRDMEAFGDCLECKPDIIKLCLYVQAVSTHV